MYKSYFFQELTNRRSSRIEIATDTNFIVGLIARVTPEFVVIDVTDGYSADTEQFVFLDAINYVRFP